jgi:hypothetical protein
VLPRFYGFSTLGNLLQLFALASLFPLATSFMGQAAGAWFKHPETPTLIFLGTSLPQFFLAGFSWPREAIPESSDRRPRPDQPAGREPVGSGTGAGCGSSQLFILRSRWFPLAARQSKSRVQRQSTMHLMVEHASLDATPVKPEAAGGGGLKGQALRAQRRARQLEVRCNLDLIGHFLPGHLIVAQAAPLIVALHPLLSSSGGMSMASRRPSRILVLGLILIAAGIGGYFLWRPRPVAPIAGGLSRLSPRKAPFGKPAFQPYWGKTIGARGCCIVFCLIERLLWGVVAPR